MLPHSTVPAAAVGCVGLTLAALEREPPTAGLAVACIIRGNITNSCAINWHRIGGRLWPSLCCSLDVQQTLNRPGNYGM